MGSSCAHAALPEKLHLLLSVTHFTTVKCDAHVVVWTTTCASHVLVLLQCQFVWMVSCVTTEDFSQKCTVSTLLLAHVTGPSFLDIHLCCCIFNNPGWWTEVILWPEGVHQPQCPLLESRPSTVGENKKQTKYPGTPWTTLQTLWLQRYSG